MTCLGHKNARIVARAPNKSEFHCVHSSVQLNVLPSDAGRLRGTDPSRERKRPVHNPALALGARSVCCTSMRGHAVTPPGTRRLPTSRWILFLVVCVVHTAGSAASGSERATLSGGADASGQNYTWTITNHSDSTIVRVEFPHFMADLATSPMGWKTELTNPLGAGGLPGLYVAEVGDGIAGIARRGSAEFRLKVGPSGTPRGQGTVLIHFANGTQIALAAEVPVKPTLGDQHISLIGLSAIFVVFLIIRIVKGRRLKQRASAS